MHVPIECDDPEEGRQAGMNLATNLSEILGSDVVLGGVVSCYTPAPYESTGDPS
jgi:hypothetical protein